MQTFRTILPAERAHFEISHAHHCLLLGSCFSENIGKKMIDAKIPVFSNPNGIVFNPISMADCLQNLMNREQPDPNFCSANDGIFHSLAHHSSFSRLDFEIFWQNLQQQHRAAQHFLQKTNRLLLTFGTAQVFEWGETGRVVANCHKISAEKFRRRRLAVQEIVDAFLPIFEKMSSQQPDFQVILTVSPVRHLRDGAVENQRSKSILLLACEALCHALPERVHYFPAYEMVMDDLRDYRFYENDMLHPNSLAINYLWEKFCQTYFSTETQSLIDKIEKIRLAALHRPFQPASESHHKFQKTQLAAINLLEKQYAFLNFEEERKHFQPNG